MRKKVIIGLCAIAAILLIPVPRRLKDGGTVEYKAVLYTVSDVHTLNFDAESEEVYLMTGTIIEVFGIEILNTLTPENLLNQK